MRTLILTLLLCGLACLLTAQIPSRSLFLELGGNGGIWSVNYERSILHRDAHHLSSRIGLGGHPLGDWKGIVVSIPVGIIYGYGRDRHFAEARGGLTLSLATDGKIHPLLHTGLGYRYQSNGRLYLRAAYTPFVSFLFDLQYQHSFGVVIGFQL